MIKNGNTRHLKIAIATLALATLGLQARMLKQMLPMKWSIPPIRF